MRVRRALLPGLVAVVTMLAGGTALAGSTPDAAGSTPDAGPDPLKSVGVQLPVDDFRAIELDEDRGRLYLAQGIGAGLPLVVTDLDGRLLTRVTGVTDGSDLALSDDRRTLFVAQGFSQISAVNLETLAVAAQYPAPAGACVNTVELAGDKVVGGFLDCGIGSGGLLVWSAPDAPPVVYTQGPDYSPVIDATPGAPGLLVAGDSRISPATTYVIDVSGDTPTVVRRREQTGSNIQGYAASPDGTEVVVVAGHPYEHRSYRLPDLADATVYPSGAYPTDAAWSGDSSTVAIGRSRTVSNGADIQLYVKGSDVPAYAVDFSPHDDLWRDTLLVDRAGTRAWAVTSDDVYQRTQLLHSFGAAHPPVPPTTDLDVTAQVGTGKHKHTAYVTVTWTSPVGDSDYWWLTAATDGGVEREIWRSRMDATGSYELTYELPRGVTTFTVRYRDYYGWYPPGHATATLSR